MPPRDATTRPVGVRLGRRSEIPDPEPVVYDDFSDIYRERWEWDRVAKGTHTRANCIAACSWNVFVKDGVVWREEQDAVYGTPRDDVPDPNPRGCQKGACYSDLQVAGSRVTTR